MTFSQSLRFIVLFVSGLILWGALLSGASAQEAGNAELETAVRAAILSDPRSAEMSEADIEQIVAALTEEAEGQEITSQDIAWRPLEEPTEAAAAACGGMPEWFCTLNEAFGFDGSDMAIPIGLAISSALLLFLIGSILLHHHGVHPIAGKIGLPGKKISEEGDYTSGVTYSE